MSVEFIVIHHSLTKDSGTVSWGAIRKYHIQKKGWQDIGYHLGIEEVNGQLEVLLGRMPGEVGAHAREQTMNWRSVGICCVGNFDKEDPSDALIGKLSQVVHWLMKVYRVPWDHVIGHRDVGLMAGKDWALGENKTCPGKRFPMEEFRSSLKGFDEDSS